MINCPKCGADNMIGAIFCRTCGEKLELDELTPEVFDAPPEPIAAKIGRILSRLILFVLLVGGIGLLAGVFWPAKIAVTGTLDQAASAKAGRKFQAVKTPSPRLPPEVPFSSDEATDVINKALGLPKTDAKTTRKPMFLSVEFNAGGECTLILKSVLFNQIPLYTTLVTKPSVSAPGSVDFAILGAKVGLIPLPSSMTKLALEPFRALKAGEALAQAKQQVKGVTIDDDSCRVKVR